MNCLENTVVAFASAAQAEPHIERSIPLEWAHEAATVASERGLRPRSLWSTSVLSHGFN